MKRYLIASLLIAGASNVQAASYLSAIIGALGNDLTFEDNSREQWVDVDGSKTINAGDRLEGFLKFDAFNPPATSLNNELYVTFSQTFGNDFAAQAETLNRMSYSGSFSSVTLNFLEKAGGFSTDWITADLSSGVQTAITALEAEGFSAFKAGLVNPEDFFAFQTAKLSLAKDFVQNPDATSKVPTSEGLGNFGAGLTIYDIQIAATFNRVIQSTFDNNTTAFGVDNNGLNYLYDLAIVNGNFGGICQNNPSCTNTTQNMKGGFVDNADAVINAKFIPEPTIISLLGIGLLGLGASKRKNA